MDHHLNCSLSNAIDIPLTYTWSLVEKTIIILFLPLVTFLGNVGNLAFLFTGYRVPRMRTVANMYLFSLAVSDVLFISTVCGLYLWTFSSAPLFRTLPYKSQTGCWLSFYPSFLCYYASIQMITLVSIERYYAICQPMKQRGFVGKQRTKKQIAICWVLAATLAVFSTSKYGGLQSFTLCVGSIAGSPVTDPFTLTIKYCQTSFAYKWFSLIAEIINDALFLTALISSSFTYVKIIQVLTKRDDTNLQSNQDNTNSKIRRQVAIMLIVNGTIFFTSQIPYRFFGIHEITSNILNIWSLDSYQKDQLTVISRICLYLNSAINPYIYIIGSKYYRQAFMEAFRCGQSKAKTDTSTSISSTVTKI